jgi:hypothetical protein
VKTFLDLHEDLRKWFSKTDPAGDWKRINSKGEVVGPCAREPGEPKPKCMSRAKRESLTKKERASAVRAKRKHDPDPERKGSPINVSNFGKGKISENMENLNEKNVPTSPEKWAQAKAQAKAKFDVYPSAYANGWAAKKYKEMGGGWKSVSEAKEIGDDPINDGTPPELRKRGNKTVITSDEIKEAIKDKFDIGEYDQEGDMAKSDLRSIMANAKRLHDMIEDADNLPEWCQNKITLAEDYISTVANYLTAEMNESDVYGKPTTEKTPTVTLKHKTSGKEIVVTKKSAPGYEKIGYHMSEEFVKTGKVAKHNKTGEETHEYAKVDKEGRKTGEREYRNAQGKPMGEESKLQESGGPVVYKKGDNHIEKYGEDSFALYKDGKKAKYYTSIEAAKEAMSEEFAGYIAHYNGQKHEIKSHEAKDLYDAKQKAITHFKIPKSKHGLLSVKPGYNEEVEQIDEISRNLADRYLSKVAQQQVKKHGMKPNLYDKLPLNRQHGVVRAFDRVLVKRPVKEETIEEQLYKQGRFVTGAGKKPFKAPTLASPKVEESKAHKVLNTFFKNREVAQRAFTGQNKTEKQKQEPEKQKVVKESRKAEIVKNIMKKKKSDKFEPDPVISDTQSKSDQTV